MGTEVAISFSSLRAQLENEKSSLFKIDENIKKIVQTTGRFNDRFNSSGEYPRGGNRIGGRNSFPDNGSFNKNEDQSCKRKHETKTVFSRLSARVNDSDGEDDGPGTKRARMPSAVCRELPTRAAVLRAQGDDEQARTRNRRIFGSLLGTLQKFKQEEIVLQTKEDKKAQVERKIEEQARLEKEREQKERKTLFAEREHKKATIKAIEAKMARVQEFERWETTQSNLGNFILTKAKPHVYWLPKKMTEKATEKLVSSRKFHEKCMHKKRLELQDELRRIELRCLRPRAAGPTAGPPAGHTAPTAPTAGDQGPEESKEGRKRDKFAMDADVKEDSDADDRHDDEPTPAHQRHDDEPVPEHEPPEPRAADAESEMNNESKMETSVDNNTSAETGADSQAEDSARLSGDDSVADDSTRLTVADSKVDDSARPTAEDSAAGAPQAAADSEPADSAPA